VSSREQLKTIADETLAVLAAGRYTAPSGARRTLDVARCVAATRVWSPEQLDELVARRLATPGTGRPRVEVTPETTGQAARRLAAGGPVAALNFASALSPGGGFLRGAKAQEEDLCRCSALFACLEPRREPYELNRALGSELYTDHVLHSPDVPFFRDDAYALLEEPFHVSVITSAAPNAGGLSDRELRRVPELLERRAAKVLALAAHEGHRRLILGAWGCGAFRNDPALVAGIFSRLLGGALGSAFSEVTFAVYDRPPSRTNFEVFRRSL
jgi:uncharacterized protein (TIGR02452 family)